MLPAPKLNRGMVIDVPVGESVRMLPTETGGQIVVTVEEKSGRMARIRVQCEDEVKIEPPRRKKS